MTPHHLAWLFLREPEQLDPQEKQTLSFLRKVQPIEVVYGLAQHFVTLLNLSHLQGKSNQLLCDVTLRAFITQKSGKCQGNLSHFVLYLNMEELLGILNS